MVIQVPSEKDIVEKATRDTLKNMKDAGFEILALSNMTRHNIPDPDNQAENKTRKFLSQTNEQTKHEFEHFKNFMTNLKENTTEKEFEENLTNYLTRIMELARSSTYTKSKTAT